MFDFAFDQIQNHAQTELKFSYLLLEGFLLHARVLYDFFFRVPKNDDVAAEHFFDDHNTWRDARKGFCPYLRNHRTRLQGLLAHLTYRRLDYEASYQKAWNIAVIHNELQQTWQRFLSLLPKDCRT